MTKKQLICISLLLFTLSCLRADQYRYPDVHIITIPKTGTNLLLKCVKLINSVHDDSKLTYWHHAWKHKYDDNVRLGPTPLKVQMISKNSSKVLLILRDPRGLIVAMDRCQRGRISDKSIRDIILSPGKHLSRVTCNFPGLLYFSSYSQLYQEYLEWLDYPFVYLTRFEDLVGPEGGGSRKAQIQEILNIAIHIEKPLTYDEASSIALQLFGGTPTFKTGQIYDWNRHFSEENLALFNQLNENLLEFLNYEG